MKFKIGDTIRCACAPRCPCEGRSDDYVIVMLHDVRDVIGFNNAILLKRSRLKSIPIKGDYMKEFLYAESGSSQGVEG